MLVKRGTLEERFLQRWEDVEMGEREMYLVEDAFEYVEDGGEFYLL